MKLPAWICVGLLIHPSTLFAQSDNLHDADAYACWSAESLRPIELRDAIVVALDRQPQLIIAKQELEKSRANLTAALTPFLPSVIGTFQDERFVPSNGSTPVTVVGNNVIGGSQTYSGYGSFGLNWNLFNGGKDTAGYRGARSGVRSSEAALNNQLNDTLAGVLQAYADVYKARRSVLEQQRILSLQKKIQARAEERFSNGTGTTIAIGQASSTALETERSVYQACHSLLEKSTALTKAAGLRLSPGLVFSAAAEPPPLDKGESTRTEDELDALLQNDPSVVSARENVTVNETKLRQAKSAYGPTLALVGRREYLGQDPDGFGGANHGIAPNSYRIGLVLQQPLLPLTSESATVASARADVRKAQATLSQAIIDVEGKVQSALGAQQEAVLSIKSALAAVQASQQVLTLTESLYKAGRTDLDNLQHAQINLEKAQSLAQIFSADVNVANWLLSRALHPLEFHRAILRRLDIELDTSEH